MNFLNYGKASLFLPVILFVSTASVLADAEQKQSQKTVRFNATFSTATPKGGSKMVKDIPGMKGARMKFQEAQSIAVSFANTSSEPVTISCNIPYNHYAWCDVDGLRWYKASCYRHPFAWDNVVVALTGIVLPSFYLKACGLREWRVPSCIAGACFLALLGMQFETTGFLLGARVDVAESTCKIEVNKYLGPLLRKEKPSIVVAPGESFEKVLVVMPEAGQKKAEWQVKSSDGVVLARYTVDL